MEGQLHIYYDEEADSQKGTAHHRSETGGMLASLGAVPLECKKDRVFLHRRDNDPFLCQCFPPRLVGCGVVHHQSKTGWKALCILEITTGKFINSYCRDIEEGENTEIMPRI